MPIYWHLLPVLAASHAIISDRMYITNVPPHYVSQNPHGGASLPLHCVWAGFSSPLRPKEPLADPPGRQEAHMPRVRKALPAEGGAKHSHAPYSRAW